MHERTLSSARQGMNMTAEEMKYIGTLLKDGLARGVSVHHVMAAHPDKFNVCQKTVYNLINSGCGGVKRHDLLAAPNRQHKVDRACLEAGVQRTSRRSWPRIRNATSSKWTPWRGGRAARCC